MKVGHVYRGQRTHLSNAVVSVWGSIEDHGPEQIFHTFCIDGLNQFSPSNQLSNSEEVVNYLARN